MRCVLKLETKAAVSDVVHMLSVPTNDDVKTMNCMQRTAGIKDDVNMQHRIESQTQEDTTCTSMRSPCGIYVQNALSEALRMTI